MLVLTGVTGLAVYGVNDGAGPLAGIMAPWRAIEDPLKGLHEFLANLTLLLVFVHVTGVIVESFAHRENLVRAMWSGRKRAQEDSGDACG